MPIKITKQIILLSLCVIKTNHNNIKYTNTPVHVKITNTLPKFIVIMCIPHETIKFHRNGIEIQKHIEFTKN